MLKLARLVRYWVVTFLYLIVIKEPNNFRKTVT